MKQLSLELKTWGGARKGAGRKPVGLRPLVSHLKRPALSRHHPVHVTLKVGPGVGYLRTYSRGNAIESAFDESKARHGLRVVHYSIQGNHLHLIVEANGKTSLSRGMQGLCVRLARGLNRAQARTGKVFADRYHAHILASRRETARAVRYVLTNYRHHAREHIPTAYIDRYSPAAPVCAPQTWLLRRGWKLESG